MSGYGLEVDNKGLINRALRFYEVVVIEYYDPDNPVSYEFSRAVRAMAATSDPSVMYLRVNVKRHPELAEGGEAPMLRVYHRGVLVFEQQGGFGKKDLDLYVLRKSIRETLRGLDINIRV